jgi:hypothetical protein
MNIELRPKDQPSFARHEPQLPPGNLFTRLAVTYALAHVNGVHPVDMARAMWADDRGLIDLVRRAVSAPAMTSVTGWAAELAQKVVADTLEALSPASAAAALFGQGLSLSFDRAAILSVPGFAAPDSSNTSAFVAEGQPIPVFQANAKPAELGPHKVAGICVLTREMIESSNAEKLVADVMIRSVGRAVDEVLFDANPGDAARPRGLRFGVAASTPSSATGSGDAFAEDVGTLAQAVSAVAGNAPITYIASPARAVSMRMRMVGPGVSVLASNAVINDLLAVATAALVSAIGSEPEIETAKATSLHMDSAPQPIGTAGPARSLWQTDAIGLKVRWPVSWVIRDPRGFAWMTPTAWK